MSIFHAYDIRGEFPDEINETITFKIARAFVVTFNPKTVVIGRDARLSSPILYEPFVKGLIEQGATVIDIGLCTTPMFYFAIAHYNHDCGAMITASHLPKEFNGIKLCREKAIPISYESGIDKIERLVREDNFPYTHKGKITKKNILKDYTKFILKSSKKTKLKVIVDAGNMMGSIDGKIISKIAKVTPLFFKTDPTFPNRGVDTSKDENLIKLRHEVIKQRADLGIAFDGDADRVAFVDNKGRIIKPAVIGSLFLKYLFKPKSKIVHELTLSKTLIETANKQKIKTIISRVGHSYMGLEMRNNNAVFGIESSGHYFFKDTYYMDFALYSAIKLINVLNKTKQPLSKLIAEIHQYPNLLIKIKTNYKDKMLNKIENLFSKGAKNILKLDGISIYHEDHWLNARISNTENIVKIMIEADNYKKLNEVRNKIRY